MQRLRSARGTEGAKRAFDEEGGREGGRKERNGDEMAEAIEAIRGCSTTHPLARPPNPPHPGCTGASAWARGTTTFLNGEARLEMIDGRSNHHAR